MIARVPPREGMMMPEQTLDKICQVCNVDHRTAKYGWSRPFWTIAFAEMWCAWIVLGWAGQMVFIRHPPSMEPVSRALIGLGMPPLYMGLILTVIGFTQLAGLFFWNRRLRLACLFCAVTFFVFVTIAFWRSARNLPGAFIVPTYVGAMTIRFVQVAGRRE